MHCIMSFLKLKKIRGKMWFFKFSRVGGQCHLAQKTGSHKTLAQALSGSICWLNFSNVDAMYLCFKKIRIMKKVFKCMHLLFKYV